MLPGNVLRVSFRRVVGGGVGLLVILSIGSSLIRSAHSAQTLSSQQDKAGASGAAPSAEEAQALEQGRSIEREISNGQSHSYLITLNTGQYLRVHVEQQGIDVTVALLKPDGKVVAESKSENGNFGPEIVSMTAEEPVEVRLEVRAPDWEAPSGRYELKIADLRIATDQDRKRVDAERAFAEGERLLQQGMAESIRKSLAEYESALQLYKSLGDRSGGAASLNKIGQVYNLTSEKRKSLNAFNQALRLYLSLRDRGGEAIALNNVGWGNYQIGERQKALDYFDRALLLSREAGNFLAESLILLNLGSVYRARGETQRALDYLDRGLRLNQVVGPRGIEGSILNNIAVVFNSIGEKQKAIEHCHQALRIFRAIRDLRGEADAINELGLAYSLSGEKRKALDYYKQALPLSRTTGDRQGEALTLSNIGAVYDVLGEKQMALDHYQQSLLIRRDIGDREGEAVTLNNLGLLYASSGERQKAIDYYNQSLIIRREVSDKRGEAVTLNNIAMIYSGLGKNQQALDTLIQSLSIRREVKDPQGEGVSLNNIGVIHARLGDNQKALEYFDQALTLRRELNDREGQAATFLNIAMARLSLGERAAAFEAFDQSLGLRRTIRDPDGEARALVRMAMAERERGNLAEALSRIEAALKIVESMRTKIDEDGLRASYLGSRRGYYELCIDLLMRLHRIDPSENYAVAAFQTSERSRARALIETLAESRAEIRNGVAPELLASERALQKRIESKKERLIRLLGGKHSEEQAAAARSEIEAIEIEYQQLQSRIRAASPRYAALTRPQPLSLAEIQQQALDDDSLLLEYAIGEERSYLWAVTKTSITAHELPGRKEIEHAASNLRDLLTARNRSLKFEEPNEKQARIAQADAEYPKAAAALSQMLLGPVTSQLERKRLLIVADGALHYVPFAALPLPETERRGDYTPLIVNHEIVSLPSASALAVLRRELAGRKPAPKTVAVLADPVFEQSDERLRSSVASRGTRPSAGARTRTAEALLESDLTRSARDLGLGEEGFTLPRLPFTRKEARTILSLAPADQRFVALDFAANQTIATSDELAKYRYVHFATHGLLNLKHPELSGIVLSLFNEQGEEQDGFLRANEVFNLNLPAELVVLSGCQTGLGKDVRGEGLVGLTRGFMYAGAARVLVSLWDVDDEATSKLMGRLYREMLGNRRLSPAAALREAQVSLWREKRWRAPYYWAGFTLQGEPR
jgi:CHAT domain-containing protein/Tfp pilus assembly protein PilF